VGEALLDLDRDAQLEAARRLVARWPGLDPQRRAGRLQRRGFDGEVISAVLDLARSE
jgi:crotonobetainyl-CoA:carnitine CoA-transferase CaiB-like acyl-CoA transferase